jgi:substrate import-associated zinc metallohydrolase lipoprotein
MKLSFYKAIAPIIFICLVLSSCQEKVDMPDDVIENLGGYRPEGVLEIDNWVKTNLRDPFNVFVKYQYDPFEIDYTKNTVPPREEFVVPVMELVLQSMVGPYLAVSDSSVVRQIMPKLWVLVGSPEYNTDGTIILGQAEGANKITIMEVNKYERAPLFVTNTCYTVHHETAHILHQLRVYTPLFRYVNPEYYTSTWFNYSDDEAYNLGFVRNYALARPDEDFVETVACLLTKGQATYDDIVAKSSELGKQRLRLKEQYVVEYFKDKWGIDFRQLQLEVSEGMEQYLLGN